LSLADVIATFTNIPAERSFLGKAQSDDQRMRLNAVSAFANRGRAVAHVRGSCGPSPDIAAVHNLAGSDARDTADTSDKI
jgi:hypothetical protein